MDKQLLFDERVSYFMASIPVCKDVAAFLVSQAALETAWFSSDVYKFNHNLFGMRFPKSRLTVAQGKSLNHAKYIIDYDSLVDYLIWMVSFGFNQSDLKDLDRFVVKLRKSPFNPSDKYVDTILKIFKTYYHD